MRDDMHDWVIANENVAKVLAAKGCQYQLVFARNAGHVDRAVRQQTSAGGSGISVAGLFQLQERRIDGITFIGREGSEQLERPRRRSYTASRLIGRERSIRDAKQILHC